MLKFSTLEYGFINDSIKIFEDQPGVSNNAFILAINAIMALILFLLLLSLKLGVSFTFKRNAFQVGTFTVSKGNDSQDRKLVCPLR